MSQPVLNSVEYQPTCYPTVAGGPANGLTVNAFILPNSQLCLTVRVRDVTGYIWYTSPPLAGSNNGIAVFNIPQILSNSIVYYVDVQWATLNTTPTWVAGQYATSVIVTDVPRLTELSIDSDLETIRASWDFPDSALPSTAVEVMVVNSNPNTLIGQFLLKGFRGRGLCNDPVSNNAAIFLRLVANSALGSLNSQPYSYGPFLEQYDVPPRGQPITVANYDGNVIQVAWGLPGSASWKQRSAMELLITSSGSNPTVVAVPAGPGGGSTVVGELGAGVWSVACRVRIGPVLGPVGDSVTLLTSAPTLTSITATSGSVTATVVAPSGTVATVTLRYGDKVLAQATSTPSNATVTLNYANVGGLTGLTLVAQAVLTSSGLTCSGPLSPPYVVPTKPPGFVDFSVTSNATVWNINVEWTLPESTSDITAQYIVFQDSSGGMVWNGSVPAANRSWQLSYTRAHAVTTKTYTLTLTTSTSTASLPAAAIVMSFALPAFTSVICARDRILAQWTAPQTGSVSSYRLRLFDLTTSTTTPVAVVETVTTQAQFDFGAAALSPTASYGLNLQLLNGPVALTVPEDNSANVLIAAPTLSSIAVSANAVAATVALPAGAPPGTLATVTLRCFDRVLAEATTTSSLSSVTLSYANSSSLTGLTLVARCVLTSGALKSYGPASAPYAAPTKAPVFTAITLTPNGDNWDFEATWRFPEIPSDVIAQTLQVVNSSGNPLFWKDLVGPVQTLQYSFLQTEASSSEAYSVQLIASTATATLPTASTGLYFAPPSFTFVKCDRDRIFAEWTAPSIGAVSAYRLRLFDVTNSTPVLKAVVETATTLGQFDFGAVALAPTASYGLNLQVVSGPVVLTVHDDGTYATAPLLVTTTPQGLWVSTTLYGNVPSFFWNSTFGNSPPDGAGYWLEFSDWQLTTKTASPKYTFASAKGAFPPVAVTVAAQMSAGNVISRGPASLPLTIPTAAPKILSADYDGVNVSVSWEAVADAVEYKVTVIGNGNIINPTYIFTGTSGRFAKALDPVDGGAGGFFVVVQAVTPSGSGWASDQMALFHAGWFVSTQAPQPPQPPPYLYPAGGIALAPATINIYLPLLGAQPITMAKVGSFALTANPPEAPTYQVLSIAGDSEAWTFVADGVALPSIRPGLRASYVQFLQDAETAGAAPWGIALLQQAIARWMPQTFAEIPYYAFGLALSDGPGTGFIDLRPGTTLRISSANYTNVWSGNSPSWLNGYAAGPTLDFDIGDFLSDNGAWTVSTDSLISRLVAAGAMQVQPPSTDVAANQAAGIADAADLFFTGFRQPFYRVYFPSQLLDPTSVGNIAPNANFALAAAPSFTNLQSGSPIPSAGSTIAYFRGRAVVRVMIRVSLNGAEALVPVGTTIGNMLDRFGNRPPPTAVQLEGLTLERAGGPGLVTFGSDPAPKPVYDVSQPYRVRLDWATMANYGGPASAMDLPLLPGDRIRFP